jgi:hypothetical protein
MKTKNLRIASAIVCIALIGLLVHRMFGTPMRYEIPGDFRGWLLVRFADQNCQPLRQRGIFLIVSVPASGWVCTSTPESNKLTYYRFEYVYPSGARHSLRWNEHGKPGTQVWLLGTGVEDKTEEIFVGEEHENWNHYPKPGPSN